MSFCRRPVNSATELLLLASPAIPTNRASLAMGTMMQSPGPSGRLKTPIQPGPISRSDVTSYMGIKPSQMTWQGITAERRLRLTTEGLTALVIHCL